MRWTIYGRSPSDRVTCQEVQIPEDHLSHIPGPCKDEPAHQCPTGLLRCCSSG